MDTDTTSEVEDAWLRRHLAENPANEQFVEEDMKRLCDTACEMVDSASPWTKIVSPKIDLSWHNKGCVLTAWKHKVVKIEIGQGIIYVKIDAGPNNMWTDAVLDALLDAIHGIAERPDIRIIVFTGEGDVFCGGESVEDSKRWTRSDCLKQVRFFTAVQLMPQFTLAIVNGNATNLGLGLVCAVDMTISVRNAKFTVSGVKNGTVPATVAPFYIQKCGSSQAKGAMMTGDALNAYVATAMGLVQEVVKDVEAAHEQVALMCTALTACGPESVATCKELVTGVAGRPIDDACKYFTAYILGRVTNGHESEVGMVALQQKKPKPWEETPITPLH